MGWFSYPLSALPAANQKLDSFKHPKALGATALCSARETLRGHRGPHFLINSIHFSNSWASHRVKCIHSLQDLAPCEAPQQWANSVTLVFHLHCSKRRERKKKRLKPTSAVHLPKKQEGTFAFLPSVFAKYQQASLNHLDFESMILSNYLGEKNTSSLLNRSVKKSHSTRSHRWSTCVPW